MKKIILILILLLCFTGCDNIQINTEISSVDEKVVEVVIRNSNFNPSEISIEKGTTIIWTNYDSQGHTVTVEGLFDSKTITKEKSFTYTFNDIGEYEYYCKIHSQMIGTIVVK